MLSIEASGFGRGSYPIDIGFVLEDGEARCMLVQPDVQATFRRLRPTTLGVGRQPGATPDA